MIPIAKPYLTKDETKNVEKTIISGWVTQGPRVEEFEKAFADYVGSSYAVAVTNCTAALHLCIIVAGIKEGDEVICPSMSFIATANCIEFVGAKPVFAETGTDYNLDIDHVESLINKKTKAILLVHQMGMPADIDAFSSLCKKHDLILIEDAACATGSQYKNKKIGSHSDLVCFSFHPRKVITTGEGGMITTSRKDFSERLRLLRQHAMSVNDRIRHTSGKVLTEEYTEVGYNYKMTDIHAAIGIMQLKKIDWIIEKRRAIADKYFKGLSNTELLRLPVEKEGYFSNYQSFCMYIHKEANINRDDLMQKLLDKGIASRRGIMTAHREPAYVNRYGNISLPVTEDLCERSIIIPLHIEMTDKETEYVISCIRELISE